MFSNFLTHKDKLSSSRCRTAAHFGKLFIHDAIVPSSTICTGSKTDQDITDMAKSNSSLVLGL